MSRRAFSLVEMIVVMGILVLLMSILMPVVGNARDAANGTLCESHVRTLTQAFIAFAADNDGHLPGTKNNNVAWTWTDPMTGAITDSRPPDNTPVHSDWLYGSFANYALDVSSGMIQQLAYAPQYGTIWPYVNNNTYATTNLPDGGSFQTYRCPSLTVGNPSQGLGSNGRFDYAAFAIFDGAALKDIPPTSVMHYCTDPTGANNIYSPSTNPDWIAKNWAVLYTVMPTPIVCQEDSKYSINSNLEGSHAYIDQLAHLHRGGSFYGSADGSVNWVNEPDLYIQNFWFEGSNLWEARLPSGNFTQLNWDSGTWNWWGNH